MAKSNRISGWINAATGGTNVSGKIPPAPTKATYTTQDFATSAAPENIGKEPALQVEQSLQGTLENLKAAYPVKAPKE